MSLKIDSDGISLKEWNSNLREKCTIKKHNGDFVIVEDSTNEILYTGSTVEKVEKYFYQYVDIKSIFQILRNKIDVCDCTLRELFDHLNNIEDFKIFFGTKYEIWFSKLEPELDAQFNIDFREEDFELNYLPFFNGGSGKINLIQEVSFHKDNEFFELFSENPIKTKVYWNLMLIFESMDSNIFDSNTLIIKKDGIYLREDRILNPLPYIFRNAVIDGGCSLLDMFNILKECPSFKMFISYYSSCFYINEFLEEIEKPCEKNEFSKQINYLEISKNLTFYQCYENNELWYINLNSLNFSGIGKVSNQTKELFGENSSNNLDEESYAIELTPVNELSHLSVHLNRQTRLFKDFEYKEKNIINRPQKIFNGLYSFRLFEVFDAIFWEISFAGSPANRDEKFSSLKEQVEEIENYSEEEIKTKYSSINDLIQDLDNFNYEDYEENE